MAPGPAPGSRHPVQGSRTRLLAGILSFFVLLNVAGLVAIFVALRPSPPVEVVSFSPSGEIEPGTVFSLRFSGLPRADERAPGWQIPEEGRSASCRFLRFEPSIPGVYEWVGPRQVIFRPAGPLPLATRWKAVVGDGELPLQEHSFWTAPLKFTGAHQVAFTPDRRATLALEFNDLVRAVDLEKHLRLRNEDGAPVDYEVLTARPAPLLRVRTLEPVERISLELTPGLRGTSGPLGLRHEHTSPVVVTRRLRLLHGRSQPVFREAPRLGLRFNHPLERVEGRTLGEFFRVEPRVEFSVRADPWNSTAFLEGDFEPGATYVVTALKGLTGSDGTLLLADASATVEVPDRSEDLAFRDRGGFLSPRGNGSLVLVTANLDEVEIAAHRVMPNNLVHFLELDSRWMERHFVREGRWQRLVLETPRNEVVENAVRMSDLVLGDIKGLWLVEARAGGDSYAGSRTLVAVSDLAITAKSWRTERELLEEREAPALAGHGAMVWVTSLASGKPVPGCRVSLVARNNQPLASGLTDANGLVRFDGLASDADGEPRVVVAEFQGDASYLQLEKHRQSLADFDVLGRPYLRRGYEAFLYGDRGVYRAGETVHLDAIVRGPGRTLPGEFPVEMEVLRPDGKRFRLLKGVLGAAGAAGFTVELPSSATTGRYSARLRLPGDDSEESVAIGMAAFFVEDFVPNRMRVALRLAASDGVAADAAETAARRLRAEESLEVVVEAEHLAGLPAAGATARLDWRLARGAFRPPQWRGFRFGDAPEQMSGLSGSLGSRVLATDGKCRFEMKAPSTECSVPLALELRASVEEVSGRTVATALSVAVDPAPYYLGVRRRRDAAVEVGAPEQFECVAVTPAGDLAAAVEALEMTLHRLEWSTVLKRDADDGRSGYHYESHVIESEIARRPVSMAAGRCSFAVTFPAHGWFKLRLRDRVTGMVTATEIRVAGGGWNSVNLERPERLEISWLPGIVRPGGTARFALEAPFAGTLLLTTESDRVLEARVLTLEGNRREVEVSIPDNAQSNVYVAASVIRAVDPGDDWKPHRAYGVAPVPVHLAARRLTVAVDVPPLLAPGADADLQIQVSGEDGHPRAAEVTVALVDEGILAWTRYATPDPWSFFYGQRGHAVELADTLGVLLPEVPLDSRRARPGGGLGERGDEATAGNSRLLNPVAARRVKSVALWLGTVTTDDEGRALMTRRLPPFTGELRVMAVAHAADRFGSGDSHVTVRGPLHVEVGLPRFAAPGDRFTSRVEVFNASDAAGAAGVEWSFDGPLGLPAPPASDLRFSASALRELFLEAGGSGRLSFELDAGKSAGVATARLAATLGRARFDHEVELPVRPPAPPITRCRNGRITAAEPLVLNVNKGFLAGTASHRLVLSTLPGVEFLGALDHVVRYPHGCLEQTISRVFPLLYLGDLAEMADIGYGATPLSEGSSGSIDGFVAAGIRKVLDLQAPRGWIRTWPGNRSVWPWANVYAAHFLVEARKAGFEVFDDELTALLDHLEREASRGRPQAGGLARAYGLYVLALAGRVDVAPLVEAALAATQKDRETPAAVAGSRVRPARTAAETRFLLAAARFALGNREGARKLVGGELPPPTTARDAGKNLRSPAREAALLLSVILDVDPLGPLVPDLVERLKSHRLSDSRWATTQENAYALMALGKYARLLKSQAVVTGAIARLGDGPPVEFRTTAPKTFEGDFSGKEIDVRLAPGAPAEAALYWSLLERGVPVAPPPAGEDSGLKVRRRHLDARGNDLADPVAGGVAVRRGAIVIVEISIEVDHSIDNVVVVDLLPAGLEVENPRLNAAAGASRRSAASPGRRAGNAQEEMLIPDHVDIRDDRLLIYLDVSRGGVYRYAARAVTEGDFALAAVSAECLYEPRIFTRHGGGRLRVHAP